MSYAEKYADLPRTRREAVELGLNKYFPSFPCPHGHISPRRIGGSCMRCAADARGHKRRANVEAARDEVREYRKANAQKVRASAKRWREQNSERHLAYTAAWRDANREHTREYSREWARQNPERARANVKNRRARIKGAEGRFTAEDVTRITKDQGSKCACCRKRRKLTVDHIVPLTKGGSNWPSNIQMLCRPCNSAKRNRDPIEHRRSLGQLL